MVFILVYIVFMIYLVLYDFMSFLSDFKRFLYGKLRPPALLTGIRPKGEETAPMWGAEMSSEDPRRATLQIPKRCLERSFETLDVLVPGPELKAQGGPSNSDGLAVVDAP